MATREREKSLKRRENKDKRPRAVAKYVRISSRKVKVSEARAILLNTPKAASEPVIKVLDSAVANAENNLDMVKDSLYVAEAYADQGPTLRRFRPRAQGRATRIRKRTSHITIILGEVKEEV